MPTDWQWWVCIAWLTGLILTAAALSGCSCPDADYGYQCGAFDRYHVTPALEHLTPGGVHYQGESISSGQLDEYTNAVETCLARSIDRSSFVVLEAPDWYQAPAACTLPQWGPQELLPVQAPEDGCTAKGFSPNATCPCAWRGGIAWPNIIVTTPDLVIYKDPLIRFLLHTSDPWIPGLSVCASP